MVLNAVNFKLAFSPSSPFTLHHPLQSCCYSDYFTDKKSRTFHNPWKIFQELFRARKCLNIKKKRHFLTLFRVASTAENSAWIKMCMLAVQNSDEFIHTRSLYTDSDCRSSSEVFIIAACFPLEPLEKCMTLKDNFTGLSSTKVIFQDFPGTGIFKKKIQDFPGGMGILILVLGLEFNRQISSFFKMCPTCSAVVAYCLNAGW